MCIIKCILLCNYKCIIMRLNINQKVYILVHIYRSINNTDIISKMPNNTTTIKRKMYKRGSSFETTLPMPMLFALNKEVKHNVLFNYDPKQNRWYVDFEEVDEK